MLKWLSGISSQRFCHQFMLAEVQGCLGLASLSLFSFTADSSNVLPISTIFPCVSHKSHHTNNTQLLGLPSTPSASRPICYHFHRQICCLGLLGISYHNYCKALFSTPQTCNAPLQPKQAVDGQTPPPTNLTTPLAPWQPSTCSSPAVPAQPNLCPPSRLNLTAFPQSTLFC